MTDAYTADANGQTSKLRRCLGRSSLQWGAGSVGTCPLASGVFLMVGDVEFELPPNASASQCACKDGSVSAAPDGSPVEVYALLPAMGEGEQIARAVTPGSSILELAAAPAG